MDERVMTRGRATRRCLVAAVTALASAGLLCAAVLAPAPTVVVPLIIAVGIALPMLVASELPPALASLRHHRLLGSTHARALAEMRAGLAKLPETRHPLGL